MVEYLSGERIQGSSTLTSSPPQTSWKELDRVTLTSAGDTLDSGTITAKDNMMILTHIIPSGNTDAVVYRFNSDTGTNYAVRKSDNGGSDSTNVNENGMNFKSTNDSHVSFSVSEFANIATQEKLGINHTVTDNGGGAGNAPNRKEMVGKWANTSNAVTNVKAVNRDGSGDFNTGSELVVLGFDNDEADSGTNFWQELADVELSSGTSNTIDTGTFTAKKYLYLQFYSIPSGSQSYSVMRFNLDEGNNYASRYSTNGGSDASHGGNNYILFYAPLNNSERFMSAFIVNNSSKEKLVVGEGVSQNTAGAGNAPERRELTGKWANTSNSITSIQMHSDSDDDNPSRLFAAGTRVKVWGSD